MKFAGSIPTVAKLTFQLARCGCTLKSNITNIIFTRVHNTNTHKIIIVWSSFKLKTEGGNWVARFIPASRADSAYGYVYTCIGYIAFGSGAKKHLRPIYRMYNFQKLSETNASLRCNNFSENSVPIRYRGLRIGVFFTSERKAIRIYSIWTTLKTEIIRKCIWSIQLFNHLLNKKLLKEQLVSAR
jgi:hypothetical protein